MPDDFWWDNLTLCMLVREQVHTVLQMPQAGMCHYLIEERWYALPKGGDGTIVPGTIAEPSNRGCQGSIRLVIQCREIEQTADQSVCGLAPKGSGPVQHGGTAHLVH